MVLPVYLTVLSSCCETPCAAQLPVGLPESGPISERVMVACDGMRLPLSLLLQAPRVVKALRLAFAKEG